MTTPLPFRAAKEFVMLGERVAPGDVVDVAPCGLARIKQMEDNGFGLRVAKDTPLDVGKPTRRKRAPAAAKSTAKKTAAKKSSTPTRKRAGTSSKGR